MNKLRDIILVFKYLLCSKNHTNKVYPSPLIIDDYIYKDIKLELNQAGLNFQTVINPKTNNISSYQRIVPKNKSTFKLENPYGYKY